MPSSLTDYTRQTTPPIPLPTREEDAEWNTTEDDDGEANYQRPTFSWSLDYFKYKANSIVKPLIHYLHTLWIGQQLALKYLIADTKRHKNGFLIGVFTVFLVVILVVLLENNVARSPIIFWRIAETSVGENDLVLTSGIGVGGFSALRTDTTGGLTNLLVHQQYIDKQLRQVDAVQGSSGRWLLFGRLKRVPNDGEVNINLHSAAAYLVGIDSVRESEIGLGRSWDYPPLGNSEMYLSRSIVREIGMDPDSSTNSPILLQLDLIDVAKSLNIGGIGGNAAAGSEIDGINATVSHTRTAEEKAEEAAREEKMTPEEKEAFILKLLIEKANPDMVFVWDRTINFGANADLANAYVDYLNVTMHEAHWNGTGYQPVPIIPVWNVGEPMPIALESLNAVAIARFGMPLTPQLLQAMFERLAPFLPGGFDPNDADYTPPMILLDPTTVDEDFRRLKNGTETYGQLFDVLAPTILDMLRIETVFTIKGVVDKPDGKWAEALGSVVLMESSTMMNLLAGSIEKLINLQSRINMSQPLNPPGTGEPLPPMPFPPGPSGLPGPFDPSGLPGPFDPSTLPDPSTYSGYPLEMLLELLVPGFNSSRVHEFVAGLDVVAHELTNNTRALLSVVQYSDRLKVYLKTLNDMNADLMQFTNFVAADGLGFDYPLTYTLPLATALQLTIYVRYFLDNIFGSVIALLVLLGMLLIYSLLLNDVDSKTYEYGMLRALGMKHQTLIQILMSKSLAFSASGIGIGLFVAFFINIPIAQQLASFANIPPEYEFLAAPILIALALGLTMPLIANIVPISRALSKTLRDSLDVYHVVVSEVTVNVIKLSELGIDLWQTAISILMIVVGFVTFFVIPWAFTFQNIPLFLGILNAILLGMLLGLCVIAQLVQPIVEKFVLRLMIFAVWPHRKLYSIVTKNLSAHSNRNRKTSQMFVICLAFLIFAGVMFNLQSRSLADNLKVFVGADLQIYSPLRDPSQHLKETEMRAYLDEMIKKRAEGDTKNYVVDSYSFVTYPLNYLIPVESVYFSSMPEFPRVRNTVYGLESNYLDVAYHDFYQYTDVDTGSLSTSKAPMTSSGDVDAVKLMFQDAHGATLPEERDGIKVPQDIDAETGRAIGGERNQTSVDSTLSSAYTSYVDVLVSESLRGAASVTISTPLHLSILSWNEYNAIETNFLAKPRAMIVKIPGFVFSSYRQAAGLASVLVSMDQYQRMMTTVYGSFPVPSSPPKQKLLVRLADSATRDQREDVINGLRTFFRSDKTQAVNTLSLIGTMDQAIALMNLFFEMVGAIAMIMCFFILWLSFTANVEENAWEFGVLRAIGLNSVEVVMIYVYESLALVLASVILGTGIGLMIAATLTLQFNLFTELPFHMEFPSGLFASMIVMAFTVAVVGSGLPAYKFLKKSISNVLRRQ